MMYSWFECALVTLVASTLGLVFLGLAKVFLSVMEETNSSIMDKVVE